MRSSLNHDTHGARGDLEVVEPSPVAAVVGEHRGVAVQFGLEECHDRFGHRVVKRITDGADGRRDAKLVDAVGVGNGGVLRSRVRVTNSPSSLVCLVQAAMLSASTTSDAVIARRLPADESPARRRR